MKNIRRALSIIAFSLGTLALPTWADAPAVVDAKAKHRGNNVYDFTVTVLHKDTGWEHYVDRWDVLTPNREFIKWRVLLHPHPNEQPFTRHLRKVQVPRNLTYVYIRAHDTVHGLSPLYRLELPK